MRTPARTNGYPVQACDTIICEATHDSTRRDHKNQRPITRCFDLSRSVEVHLLSNIHSGKQTLAVAGITSGLVGLGQQVTWRAKHFGLWHNLTTEIAAMESPHYLQVTMIHGIFRFMQTDHRFESLPSGGTPIKTSSRLPHLFRCSAQSPKRSSCDATCSPCCVNATASSSASPSLRNGNSIYRALRSEPNAPR